MLQDELPTSQSIQLPTSQSIHVYVARILFFDVISTEILIVVQADYDRFSTPYPSLGARGHNLWWVGTNENPCP